MRVGVAAALTIGVVLAGAQAVWAADPSIGAVREVQLAAFGTPPGGARIEMQRLDPVVVEHRLETSHDGELHVRFLDESELWLGGDSDIVLDRIVYDPARGAGEFVLELGPGLFRLLTGLMPHEAYSIRTPTAVIGVRGTDFAVAVAADGATRVTVYSGAVTVAPRGGGPGQAVAAAETASVASPTGAVSVSAETPAVAPPTMSVDGVDSASADAVDAQAIDVTATEVSPAPVSASASPADVSTAPASSVGATASGGKVSVTASGGRVSAAAADGGGSGAAAGTGDASAGGDASAASAE